MDNSLGPSYFPPKKILVAVDGSANAFRSAVVALSLAKDYGAQLRVLNVVPPPIYYVEPYVDFVSSHPGLQEYYDYSEKEATRYLDKIVSSAREQGVKVSIEVIHAATSVVESITSKALDENTDLIVIGTRGLGEFKRLLLGSVSSGTVMHAHCNVLVVR